MNEVHRLCCPKCGSKLSVIKNTIFDPGYPDAGLPKNFRDLHPKRFFCSPCQKSRPAKACHYLTLDGNLEYIYTLDDWTQIKITHRIVLRVGKLIGEETQ